MKRFAFSKTKLKNNFSLRKKLFFFSTTILLFIVRTQTSFAQSNEIFVQNYLNSIRDNSAELTAFFQQMPKGGDLHHHYSGSIYAETYFDFALEKNYWLNTKTLALEKNKPVVIDSTWQQLLELQNQKILDIYKEKLLQLWSAKDFDSTKEPSYKHFFDSFGHFSSASNNLDVANGLKELKKRAQSENVQYIETMLVRPRTRSVDSALGYFNDILHNLQSRRDEKAIGDSLQSLTAGILRISPFFNEENMGFIKEFEKIHQQNNIDDSSFTMRYLCSVVRYKSPIAIFNEILNAFYLASGSNLIVGVNIVAPEHEEVAMKDYWLHCRMFKFCHELFPNVKYTMHAGELRMGMVKPEELTWHIDEAVRVAKANRIGHGVDMATERNVYDLLNYMHTKNIAVELNLVSNAFILGIKNDAHPISLYKKAGVPIVISSDDAGILRSDMTEQFVLLARSYRNISYKDIKQFVVNSIDYSFIKEPEVKTDLKRRLEIQFTVFEKKVKQWGK